MIRVEKIHKRFGPKHVLQGLDLTVGQGEIVFVIGKSGTGKSVLLKHIVGLMQPDSGAVFVDGVALSGLSESALYQVRRRCGMVFQHPALLDSLTVTENVVFGIRAHGLAKSEAHVQEEAIRYLRMVSLDESLTSKYPPELSFAVQKRVSLARTLAVSPNALLFDEPTTAQDPVATRAINHLILELSKSLGVSCLVVSHDMHCAIEIADKIVMMDEGKAVAVGTPKQMLQETHSLVAGFMKEAKERVYDPG